MIKSSSSLLTSAKSLAVNPNDPPTWQLLASHTKSITDAIKSLIMSIRYGEGKGRGRGRRWGGGGGGGEGKGGQESRVLEF